MPWTPLATRSAEIVDQITKICSISGTIPEEIYNQNNLGLMNDSELESWLGNAMNTAVQQAEPANPQESLPEITESEESDARSLRWVRLNGRTAADKSYAKDLYRFMLFQLWRKHVAETGQTYYPPLRDDVWDHYQLISDSTRN